MEILHILIFLFLAVANSDNLCPSSYCPNNNFPIKYPFRLQGQQTPNCSYTNLTCTTKGAVILNLPNLGDFYVRNIHYGNGYPLILLYDPQNCLPNRFMNSNLSSFGQGMSPPFLYYTFYSCPPNLIAASDLPAIGCMSNSSSTTVATRTVPSSVMATLYGCTEIVTSPIPVGSDRPDFLGNQTDFMLEWGARSCKICPFYEKRAVPLYVVEMTTIVISAAAVIMPIIICIGCCISFFPVVREEIKAKRSSVAQHQTFS